MKWPTLLKARLYIGWHLLPSLVKMGKHTVLGWSYKDPHCSLAMEEISGHISIDKDKSKCPAQWLNYHPSSEVKWLEENSLPLDYTQLDWMVRHISSSSNILTLSLPNIFTRREVNSSNMY